MNTYYVTLDGQEGFYVKADSVDIHSSGALVFYRKGSLFAAYTQGMNWGFVLEEEGVIETL